MKKGRWLVLFLLALTSLGVGMIWKRSVEFEGRIITESEYGFGQQPHCWGCVAVRNPEFRPGRGPGGGRDSTGSGSESREGEGQARGGGQRRRGGRES